MSAKCMFSWDSLVKDEWLINISVFPSSQTSLFATSSSNGTIYVHDFTSNGHPILELKKAHESSINALLALDENTLSSCSTDGIKLWDIRSGNASPILSFNNEKKSKFLSLATNSLNKGSYLAGGCELVGSDAELHIWDIRNPSSVVRSFVDSHHDDITSIEFHPSMTQYLMSGSTDGYVNIYNLLEEDEDEALHQVINYASVHSCHFTREKRISVLSHMETLSFYELNNTNYDKIEESPPNDLQDLRYKWDDCEYVVDLFPSGYVVFGANSSQKLTLYPFDPVNEKFNKDQSVSFPGAHGDEVVRDFKLTQNNNVALTCGEDGAVNFWQMPHQIENYSIKNEIMEDQKAISVDLGEPENTEAESESKKVKKDKKDKKDKKHTDKSKKHKHKHKGKDIRFKPY